jgi:dolichol-phosphate mannosyltransferase
VLSRNFGHPQAYSAAIDAASGDAVVLMDSDLQDPPELIPALLERWHHGYEVVYAERRRRDETGIRRLLTGLYHRLFRLTAGIPVPVDAGNFCLLDRRIADVFVSFTEQHRYLPGLRAWAGYRQVAVQFDRPRRVHGTPKLSIWKLIALALDGILSFSILPLRLAAITGLILAAGSIVAGAVVLLVRLSGYALGQTGWTSLILLNVLLGGMILTCLGIMGEYIGRIYEETKRRPYYLVRERLGFPPGSSTADPKDPSRRRQAEMWQS